MRGVRQVRCPKCGRLLAVQRADGMVEIKADRRVILTDHAYLSCLKCGGEIRIEKKGVDKTQTNRLSCKRKI